MKKHIIITSIFSPTEAVKAFAANPDYKLIVVGDKKSPENWEQSGVQYLSVADQLQLDFESAKVIPYNHYSRKMLGYLVAMQEGAQFIVDTDDDNIPKSDWNFPPFEGEFDLIKGGQGYVNIYQHYSDEKIWPRGLPLKLINTQFNFAEIISKSDCKVGIWQGLADEDPDVDAIYRLTSDKPCYFNNNAPIVLDKGTICPFNTQNTMIERELFPLLYLPTYVTFRYTDILRGLVAQPIMWEHGFQLGFTNATVVQKRNPHDYMKDFISEIPMYETGEKAIEIVSSVISAKNTIAENLQLAYEGLERAAIVSKQELVTLEAWLKDISRI